MLVETLPEDCEHGSHAVARATGTLDREVMSRMGVILARRYGISRPNVELVCLNAASSSLRKTTNRSRASSQITEGTVMHKEHLDLTVLTQRLRDQGPFITLVDGRPHKVIAAQRLDDLNRVRDDSLVALPVDAGGKPAANHLVTLNNGIVATNMAAGPLRMAICHHLSIDDLIAMATSVHGQPSWHNLHRCVSWTVSSVWNHGVEPLPAEVDALLEETYHSPVLWGHIGHTESLSFLAWMTAGRDATRLSRYFDMALYARICATQARETAAV